MGVDDAQLEQTREVGRLKGQVDQLQSQAREAIHREQELRTQALESEESMRKEQRALAEATKKWGEFERTIRELEARVSLAQQEADPARKEFENGAINKGRDGKERK